MILLSYINIHTILISIISIFTFDLSKKLTKSNVVSVLIAILSFYNKYNYTIFKNNAISVDTIFLLYLLLTLFVVFIMFKLLNEYNDDSKNDLKVVVDFEDDRDKKSKAKTVLLLIITYSVFFFISEYAIILFLPIFIIILFTFRKVKVMNTKEHFDVDISKLVSIISYIMVNILLYMIIYFSNGGKQIEKYSFLNNLNKINANNILHFIDNIKSYLLNENGFLFLLLLIIFILVFSIYMIIKIDYMKRKKEKMLKVSLFYEFKIDIALILIIISYILYFSNVELNNISMHIYYLSYIVYMFIIYFYRENKINLKNKNDKAIEDNILMISNYIFTIMYLALNIYINYTMIK